MNDAHVGGTTTTGGTTGASSQPVESDFAWQDDLKDLQS